MARSGRNCSGGLPLRRLTCPRIESDAESDAFAELSEGVFGDAPRHYLLGHPSPVQDNDMDLQCQLVTHGLYCGDSSGYDAPERPALEPGSVTGSSCCSSTPTIAPA